jgi:capsular polysaccharide transport system permease protein
MRNGPELLAVFKDENRTMARTSLQIMRDTIHALLMRELKTRFGAKKLGYFWAIAEPAAQASIIALLFSLIGRSSLSGVPVALFLISGILPFKFFSKLLPQLGQAVQANKSLFAYRQVTAIDPIITRLIIETATFVVVYSIILLVMAWIGFDVWPDNLLALLSVSGLLVFLGAGTGLILCSAVSYWEDSSKVVAMVMMPMFMISGVFFCATMIPAQYWYLFDWNPIFHVIELSRDAMFASYTTPVGSWQYVGLWALSTVSVGLMLYQVNRNRFITT